MPFFIAHAFGFVEADVVMNGVHHPMFTRDLRKAQPFSTYREAEKLMHINNLGKYFSIVKPASPTDDDLVSFDNYEKMVDKIVENLTGEKL